MTIGWCPSDDAKLKSDLDFDFLSTDKWKQWRRQPSFILANPVKLNLKMPDFLTVKMPVLRLKSPYSFAVLISKVPKESVSFLIGDDAAAVSACLDWSLGDSNGFVHTATEKTGTVAAIFDLFSSWICAFKSVNTRKKYNNDVMHYDTSISRNITADLFVVIFVVVPRTIIKIKWIKYIYLYND